MHKSRTLSLAGILASLFFLGFNPHSTFAQDLAVTLTVAPTSGVDVASGNLTYTASVTNNGPANVAFARLETTLPANMIPVSVTPRGSCTFTSVGNSATVNCRLGPIVSGSPAVRVPVPVTIVVHPIDSVGLKTATTRATLVSPGRDPVPGNNTASASITTVDHFDHDVQVTLADAPDPHYVNERLTYTATVTNSGSDSARGVVLTSVFPPGVNIVSASSTLGSCTTAGVVVCQIDPLGVNRSATPILATVTIVVDPLREGFLYATVAVVSDNGRVVDRNLGNNSATARTYINPR